MDVNYRVLEVTVISCEDLCVTRKQPVKKNAFVVIKTTSGDEKTQATKVDKDGGSYPAWDEKLLIDMPMHARYFTAEVRCKIGGGGSRLVGTAKIPASDFLDGLVPESYLHFLSYRLWDSSGQRNGIINLSVRVKSSPAEVGYSGASCSRQPWSGFPASDNVSGAGTVTGIPVW